MSLIVGEQDSDSVSVQCYSRKEKSLGLLVSNFLGLYNRRDDVDLIGLDDAAGELGVERRRIYDVVNILESIGVVARKGKNQYSWKGFGEIPPTLNELKEQGMRERFGGIPSICCKSEKVYNDDETEESFSLTPDDQEIYSPLYRMDQENSSSLSKTDHKKEKSLWLLSQNFVKMLLCSNDDLITLDSAAKALLSDSQDSVNMRTKIRRLYDIANVLSSMHLIEKTHFQETRKPAYKWLGSKYLVENGSTLFNSNETKKRTFGRDITNLRIKRNKTDTSSNLKQIGNNKKHDQDSTEQESKPAAKSSYVFGPFSPTSTTSDSKNNNNNNSVGRLQDLEALASTYKPQYCNHELMGLLGHYTEAWRSWYAMLDN